MQQGVPQRIVTRLARRAMSAARPPTRPARRRRPPMRPDADRPTRRQTTTTNDRRQRAKQYTGPLSEPIIRQHCLFFIHPISETNSAIHVLWTQGWSLFVDNVSSRAEKSLKCNFSLNFNDYFTILKNND